MEAGVHARRTSDRRALGVHRTRPQKPGEPGVAIGLVPDGTVVFMRGFVVKDIGGTTKPDADTLSSRVQHEGDEDVMLATLVDEGKLTRRTPMTRVSFKLGDPTRRAASW